MQFIQCFGGIGANVVDVDQAFVDAHTTSFQTYVPFDPTVHAKFKPRDVVDHKTGALDSAYRLKAQTADILDVDHDAMVVAGLDAARVRAARAVADAAVAAAEAIKPSKEVVRVVTFRPRR